MSKKYLKIIKNDFIYYINKSNIDVIDFTFGIGNAWDSSDFVINRVSNEILKCVGSIEELLN